MKYKFCSIGINLTQYGITFATPPLRHWYGDKLTSLLVVSLG